MTTRAKPDRRINRTQQSLHVALNSLIIEKGYEGVTINDITHRANVGRSTFYAHHGSKEGLLLHGLQHLRMALGAVDRASLISGAGAQKPILSFSGVFFAHLAEYRDIYQALIDSSTGPIVTKKLKRIITDLVTNEFSSTEVARRKNEVPREALIQFTVDALFSVLAWWFERSPKLPPAEVDAIFRRLVLPAFAAGGIG